MGLSYMYVCMCICMYLYTHVCMQVLVTLKTHAHAYIYYIVVVVYIVKYAYYMHKIKTVFGIDILMAEIVNAAGGLVNCPSQRTQVVGENKTGLA